MDLCSEDIFGWLRESRRSPPVQTVVVLDLPFEWLEGGIVCVVEHGFHFLKEVFLEASPSHEFDCGTFDPVNMSGQFEWGWEELDDSSRIVGQLNMAGYNSVVLCIPEKVGTVANGDSQRLWEPGVRDD